jgi:hypothetical protein
MDKLNTDITDDQPKATLFLVFKPEDRASQADMHSGEFISAKMLMS